jgi:hypothetical protein
MALVTSQFSLCCPSKDCPVLAKDVNSVHVIISAACDGCEQLSVRISCG